MKALITGGCGFIGSHLTEYLLDKGDTVTVIDDLSTGRLDNVKHLKPNKNFNLFVGSILNRTTIEAMVRETDVVYHLASAVGVGLILQKPVRSIEAIVEGSNIILSRASRYGKKVLITSSSEVYGKGSKIPFSEEDDTVMGPTNIRRWSYGAGKAIAEFYAFSYHYETQLPVVCVRLFNTVGPRQSGQYGMVIPRFIDQALRGEDITVYGDGEQTRSFCHVNDVVPALVKMMECPEAVGKVINIGSNEEVAINHLAWLIKEFTGTSSQITHIPYGKAYADGFEDMPRRVPDITLAKQLIGFEPKYKLDDILGVLCRR